MEKKALLNKLNWFYTLEINQVRMYSEQSARADNPHLARALKLFASTEQGHVEKIQELIEKMEGTPSIVAEALGKVSGSLAGHLTAFSDWNKVLEFNVMLEQKAVSDYAALAEEVEDQGIREVLLDNMVEEEMHASWMEGYVMK